MTTQINQDDIYGRIARVHNALRGLSALATSVIQPDEALMGKRGDLGDLLDILADELNEAAQLNIPNEFSTGKRFKPLNPLDDTQP